MGAENVSPCGLGVFVDQAAEGGPGAGRAYRLFRQVGLRGGSTWTLPALGRLHGSYNKRGQLQDQPNRCVHASGNPAGLLAGTHRARYGTDPQSWA